METLTEKKIKEYVIRPLFKNRFSAWKGEKAKTTIGPELDRNGFYKTGLSKEEQKEYETKLGLKEGTLGPRSEWWGNEIWIKLFNDKPTLFQVQGPMDELKERVLFNSTKVAKNSEALKSNPEALFVIDDEELTAEMEEKAIDAEFDAFELLMQMSATEKRNLLKVIIHDSKTNKRGIDEMSDKLVKLHLSKEVKSNPEKFVRIAKDRNLQIKVLIASAVEYNIIKRGANNTYRYGDDIIGYSTEEAVEYLLNKNHATQLLSIQTKLEEKGK